MFISTWVLLVAGLVFAFPMIYSRVKDHTELEDEILYVYFICFITFKLLVNLFAHLRMRMDDVGNLINPHQVPHDQVPEKQDN